MPRPAHPRRIALLGAESTGKTHLAEALAERLRAQGQSALVISEVLRAWCERQGRTPHVHEQAGIALEQARRVLAPIEEVFTEQQQKLLETDVTDLDVQIEVLTTQLKREGVV